MIGTVRKYNMVVAIHVSLKGRQTIIFAQYYTRMCVNLDPFCTGPKSFDWRAYASLYYVTCNIFSHFVLHTILKTLWLLIGAIITIGKHTFSCRFEHAYSDRSAECQDTVMVWLLYRAHYLDVIVICDNGPWQHYKRPYLEPQCY